MTQIKKSTVQEGSNVIFRLTEKIPNKRYICSNRNFIIFCLNDSVVQCFSTALLAYGQRPSHEPRTKAPSYTISIYFFIIAYKNFFKFIKSQTFQLQKFREATNVCPIKVLKETNEEFGNIMKY